MVRRLRDVGAEPSARELADALWLARWASPGEPLAEPAPEPDRTGTAAADTTGAHGTGAGTPAAKPGRDGTAPQDPVDGAPARRRRGPGDDTVPLHTTGPHPAGGTRTGGPTGRPVGVPVRVPVANALPSLLPLQRALRPLQRYRPPVHAVREDVDEQATAERAAETGLVVPVLRRGARRTARVQLLMDVSSSMVPWEEMCAELRQACAGAGAFRDVKVHFLHEDAETGEPAVGSEVDARGRALRPAGLLRDPTGHWITLLLSDCAGPMWRSGRMQRQLNHWAQTSPVAVIQPLPQRMWRRTHLPALPGVLRRRQGMGGQLAFRPASRVRPAPREAARDTGAWAVPVLAPTETALGNWARLVSGVTGVAVNAAAGWVRPAHPAARAPRAGGAREPGRLLAAFEGSASPDAVQLAVYLSATELALPVMQLVQRAMLPHTGPSELAEVLLSGLLRREGGTGPGERVAYEFHDGVRELLLERLSQGDAALVLKECSTYVERHFGRRTRNFPAMAADYLGGTVTPPSGGPAPGREGVARQPFARVSQAVLRRFMPRWGEDDDPTRHAPREREALRERARHHWNRYHDDGTARELEAAIAHFRALGGPETDESLARALLERWRVTGDREDLLDAYEALRRVTDAYPEDPGVFVRADLVRVLTGLADEVRTAPDWPALRVLPAATGRAWQDTPADRLHAEYLLLLHAAGAAPTTDGARDTAGGAAGAVATERAALHLRLATLLVEMPEPPEHPELPGSLDRHGLALHHLDAADAAVALPDADQLRQSAGVALALSRAAPSEHAAVYAEKALAGLEIAHARQRMGRDGRRFVHSARYWLDRAEARTRAAGGLRADRVFATVLHEADTALAFAREADDPALWAEAVCALGGYALRGWAEGAAAEADGRDGVSEGGISWRGDDDSSLREVLPLLREARAGLPREQHGRLRHMEARLQLALARAARDAGRAGEAVRLLRECRAEAGEAEEMAEVEQALGEALLVRYRLTGPADRRWSDVEEAEAMFSSVTRTREARPRTVVDAWATLAGSWLDEHTEDSRYRRASQASRFLHNAAHTAEDAGLLAEAAQYRWRRARVIEAWLGGGPAVSAYEQIAQLWERNGEPAHEDVTAARERARVLGGGEA
nr:SAV_2336 N-terminal domain-related protein [Streptomyces sp. HNM0574]